MRGSDHVDDGTGSPVVHASACGPRCYGRWTLFKYLSGKLVEGRGWAAAGAGGRRREGRGGAYNGRGGDPCAQRLGVLVDKIGVGADEEDNTTQQNQQGNGGDQLTWAVDALVPEAVGLWRGTGSELGSCGRWFGRGIAWVQEVVRSVHGSELVRAWGSGVVRERASVQGPLRGSRPVIGAHDI